MPHEPIDPQDETHSPEIAAPLFSDSLEHGLQAAYGNSAQKGMAAETATRTNVGRIISNRYRLLEKIGEGGMGSVWMAEQFEPLKRLVAIKLIKPGMGSREVLGRFQAEQQALAVLDHPNIAKILDAGLDELGMPYFVMELIKGVPITRYCDELRLGTKERLELFVPICQAIQHAHQKGLIHRDIKPSNLLIARFDEIPVPKVIDFGVAKAVGPILNEGTIQTGFNAIVGTLEYMSPEQATFNNRDIDTRADIYALGAVLYELLVGSPPISRQVMTDLAVDEVLKFIRETDPPTPSHKFSSAERRASIAAQRSCEPDRLMRVLQNDLDWIVMKALEKERARRYDSSSALGEDIQRFLLGEAVAAAPPSRMYRLKKWYRRHRVMAWTATLMLILLLAGIGGTSWRYFYAQQQQTVAEQKAEEAWRASELAAANEKLAGIASSNTKAFADHLVNDFLRVARPEGWNGGRGIHVTIREALVAAELAIDDTFRDHPIAEAIARMAYAQTWHDLGEYSRAEVHWRQTMELFRKEPGFDIRKSDSLWLQPRVGLGHCLLKQSKVADAKTWFEVALKDFGDDREDLRSYAWPAHVGLAEIDLLELRPQQTLDRLLPILTQAERDLPQHRDLIVQISTLVSAAYEALGQMDKALELDQRMLQLGEENLGPDHVYTLILKNAVAQNHWKLRQYEEAIPKFRALVDACSQAFGPEHPTTLEIKINLAANLSDSGQLADGEALLTELIPQIIAKRGPQHEKTLEARKLLGIVRLKQKQFAEAEEILREVWQDSQQALGEDHAETMRVLSYYCESLQQAGKLVEALPFRETLLRLRRNQADRQDPDLLPTMNNLASLYWRTGQLAKSIPLFREVVTKCQAEYGMEHRRTLQALANLAVNLRDDGQVDEAITILQQACEYSPKHAGLEWIADELMLLYLAQAQREAAMPLLVAQEGRLRAAMSEVDSRAEAAPLGIAHRQTALAENLVRQQRMTDAEPLLKNAIATYEAQQPTGWQLASAKSLLAEVLLVEAATNKPDPANYEEIMKAAETLLLGAQERLASAASDQSIKSKLQDTRRRLQRLYELWGKSEEVGKWYSNE
jgi:tetratricopeptide (TPR) repeat protein